MQTFIETINTFGAWLVENFRRLSIELLILAGIVAVILFLLRVRSPRVRYAFWLLVLAKPVVTLLIASPISLYWFLQPAAPMPAPPARTVFVAPAARPMPTPQRDHISRPHLRGTGGTEPAVEADPVSAWSQISIYGVAALVWVVIASALGLRLLVGYVYVTFLRKTAEVQRNDTALGEALLEAAGRLNMRPRGRVALSGVSHAPVLAGILRPMILLPRALPRELPPEQVRLVIAHELTHIRRWDNLVLLLQRIAEMLLFFHPVVWLCGWVMRREAENACDDAVLQAYGLSAEYAESLTRVAETHHNLARRLLVNTFAAAESNLARRVRRILTGRPGRTTLILSISAVVALVLLGCLGLPTTAEKNPQPQTKKMKNGNTMTRPEEQLKATVQRDGGKVNMPAPSDASGNTYARGMSSVLSYLGTDISYDRVMGLTGVAFILQVDTSGPFIDGELDCAWWPNNAWGFDLGLPVLSKATGWELRKIRCTDAEAYKADPAAEYHRVLAPTIEKSLAAGKPVLAEHAHCFIVTAIDNEEPPLLGYGTQGKSTQFKDILRISDYPLGLIAFGEKADPLNSKEIDLLSLQHIVALFNEQTQGVDAPKTRFSGRQAWNEWLALLRKGVGCDNNMLIHLRYNRGSAVAYLRDMAGRHAGEIKEHLNAAAELYQQALDELNKQDLPYGRVQNGESEQAVSAEYTAMVERVFALEMQAIEHLGSALLAAGITPPPAVEAAKVSKSSDSLSATSNGVESMSNTANFTITESTARNIRREGDKVWIEGVKGFDPCEYDSSVHGSDARILQTLGESLSYDDLICYSAFAFRVGFHNKNCPSAGHPCCGYVCIENGVRALPWNIKVFEIHVNGKPRENQAAFEAEARAAVKASIDRGIPVHYGSEEDGLIIGYGDEGRRWWCVHPYYKNGAEAFWYDEDEGFAGGKDKWPWGIAVWTEPKSKEERVSKRDLTLAALRQAVDMWKTEKRGDYFVGDAAYAFWLQWLHDVEAGKVKDPKAGMLGSAWCFDVLIHSRRIAGKWLNKTADDFSGETAKQMHIAANHYSQIAEECMKDIKSSWDLAPSPKQFDTWTSQMRRQQIDRLEAARQHDRAAITAITKALNVKDSE